MKYKDWPITNFLLNETKCSSLINLTNIKGANKINIKMSRDAWQAASRPPIEERNIAPEGLLLSDLTSDIWSDIVVVSLGCLNKQEGHKGRGNQVVTLINKEPHQKKQMPVSPHLGFKVTITNNTPQSMDSFLVDLKNAQKILMPLYELS